MDLNFLLQMMEYSHYLLHLTRTLSTPSDGGVDGDDEMTKTLKMVRGRL